MIPNNGFRRSPIFKFGTISCHISLDLQDDGQTFVIHNMEPYIPYYSSKSQQPSEAKHPPGAEQRELAKGHGPTFLYHTIL